MEAKVKKIIKKTDPKKDEVLTEKNKKVVTAKAAQEIIIHRDLKYVYPKDVKDTLKRKAYRQKIRNALRKMYEELAKAHGAEKKTIKEKIAEFEAKHLTV